MRKRTLQIRMPIGAQRCGACPYTPRGTSQCPLFTAVLDAGRTMPPFEWKDATCGIGEKDNEIYRCKACLDAEVK